MAIVGGFVYRGSAIPRLAGKYVFADLNGAPLRGRPEDRRRSSDCSSPTIFIKGFGQDAHGELYVLGSTNIGPSGTGGVILAIRAAD